MDPGLRFMDTGGGVAALMRGHDWSACALGPPLDWPQALRSVVGLMLASKFPMFLAWGPALCFLYNDAYAEILGKKHPDALGRPFQEIWHEIWDDIGPLVDRALAGEATFQENLPLLMHRKGYDEQTWFTFSYSPLFDEQGAVAGMYCACTETTAAVLASRRHQHEIDRLRQMFRQAPGLVAVLSGPQHVFELANEAYLQLVGARDLIGKRVLEALPEVEGQGFVDLLDNVYRSGEPYIGRGLPVRLMRNPEHGLEQRFVDFIYQPLRDEAQQVTGIFVEGSDVTEAVNALEALRHSEQRLRQLANTMHHLAWMAGPDGQAQWYNDRWYELTGLTRLELHGPQSLDMVHPDDRPHVAAGWANAVREGTPYESEMRLRRADGTWRRFLARAAPVRDASGQIVQWFGTSTDITDAENAKEALLEGNRRKDEFLAMLAHELRNPLAPISTAAQVLHATGHDDPRVRGASEIISRQVGHMVSLVDDLLDVSRVTRGLVELKLEHLDVDDVIAHAVEQVRPLLEARGHTLSLPAPGTGLHVTGDRTRITQVLANLLNNAAKYTPHKGDIRIRTHVQEGNLVLAVEDNGIGIDAVLLPHVFTLFTQAERTPDRSQGGLGIGLALARSLAELHGGTLQAYSAGTGSGARFTLTLPLAPESSQSPSTQHEARAIHGPATRRVMVVDDNADAGNSLADLLRVMGFAVTVHRVARDALRDARVHRYDALVLDIGMPGMDGYELAHLLRTDSASADARLIALTGYGQEQDRERALASGFDTHLIKPADPHLLLAALAQDGHRAH